MASSALQSEVTTLQWRESVREAVQKGDIPRFDELMDGKPNSLLLSEVFDRFVFWFEQGDKIMHCAAKHGHVQFVEKLFHEYGVPPNQTVYQGNITPLHSAAESGQAETLQALLSIERSNINVIEKYGETPLIWAVNNGHAHIVEILLTYSNCKVNKPRKDGQTPLHRAAVRGRGECMRLLLAHPKCKTNAQANNGETPLHMAVFRREGKEAIDLLTQQESCEVDIKDKEGNTPLHWAARYGNLENLVALERAGASFDAMNHQGQTPLQVAEAEEEMNEELCETIDYIRSTHPVAAHGS